MSKKKQHIRDAFNKFVDANDCQSIQVMMEGYYNVIQTEINGAFERAFAANLSAAAITLWNHLPHGTSQSLLSDVITKAVAYRRTDVVQHILDVTEKPTRFSSLQSGMALAVYGGNLDLARYLLAWEKGDGSHKHLKIIHSVYDTPQFLYRGMDARHRTLNVSEVAVKTNTLPFIQSLCAHNFEYVRCTIAAVHAKTPEISEHSMVQIQAICHGMETLLSQTPAEHRTDALAEDAYRLLWKVRRRQQLDIDAFFEATAPLIDWHDMFLRCTGIKTNTLNCQPAPDYLIAQDLAPHMPTKVLAQAASQLKQIQNSHPFLELAGMIAQADIVQHIDEQAGTSKVSRRM